MDETADEEDWLATAERRGETAEKAERREAAGVKDTRRDEVVVREDKERTEKAGRVQTVELR